MKNIGIKGVVGYPSEIKSIKGISPINGKVTLNFKQGNFATLQINDGPAIVIEDCETHWSVERNLTYCEAQRVDAALELLKCLEELIDSVNPRGSKGKKTKGKRP